MRAEREQQAAQLAEEKCNAGGKIQRELLTSIDWTNVLPRGKFCVRSRAQMRHALLSLSPCGRGEARLQRAYFAKTTRQNVTARVHDFLSLPGLTRQSMMRFYSRSAYRKSRQVGDHHGQPHALSCLAVALVHRAVDAGGTGPALRRQVVELEGGRQS